MTSGAIVASCKGAMLGLMLCNAPNNTEACGDAIAQFDEAQMTVSEQHGEPADWAGKLLAQAHAELVKECQ